MKTFSAKIETIERKWLLVDAKDKVLGRLASKVASLLRGKHKPIFTPHVDTGDHVIVINADQIKLTGEKLQSKVYYHHSGYTGGLKEIPAQRLFQEKPERMITLAIKGMLPKNKLGRAMIKKLKVYKGTQHPHEPQQPQAVDS
ncbi:MAG TPA: 50S ribosomal protein L13 [Nitrospiria bacterium]